MPTRLAHRSILLLALLLAAPSARAEGAPLPPPVRATWDGTLLTLETDEIWMTAELSFPGWGRAPVLLGPSFPGARWNLSVEERGERLQLAWVTPSGAGVSLELPLGTANEGAAL